MTLAPAPTDLLDGHEALDAPAGYAVEDHLSDRGHVPGATQNAVAPVGTTSTQGQAGLDDQTTFALGGHNFPDDHHTSDAQSVSEVGEHAPAGAAKRAPTPNELMRPLLDPLLTFASITLDDLEAQRKAQENRYRSLTRSGVSENGLEWGFGLDDRDPSVAAMGAIVEQFVDLEKQATKQLEKLMRKHPLGPWVKAQKGIGDKQAARLLGVIGDPYWHSAEERPRTVSELWAYCGLKPGQKRQKGQQANWSNEAKMRAWNLAGSAMKQLDPQCKTDTGIAEHVEGCGCSPYRKVIDARRERTRDRVHAEPCVRCGPSGRPAEAGSPWSKAHQLADALRIASKEILKDMWRESRRIHHAA